MQTIQKPITDAEALALTERNAARVAQITARMGQRHLLHPANAPKRSTPRSVLTWQAPAVAA